ncbi:hypothetical protein IMAU10576_02440 [Lactiplantibacillus plantarum]|nr:hypothetical protein [Lactiplantibacillus plantarum]
MKLIKYEDLINLKYAQTTSVVPKNKKEEFASDTCFLEVPDEVLYDTHMPYYTVADNGSIVGMKPVGRLYFYQYNYLDHSDGTAVECPVISGGEKGVVERYLHTPTTLFTEEQVLQILHAALFEKEKVKGVKKVEEDK